VLVQNEHLPIRSPTEAQIHPRGGFFALFAILILNQFKQSLGFAIVIEQNPADSILSALREIIRIEVKDFSAGQVTEQDAVPQLRNRVVPVNDQTDGGRLGLEERVQLPVFRDGIGNGGIAPRILRAHFLAADETKAPFPGIPSEVRPGGDQTDLLDEGAAVDQPVAHGRWGSHTTLTRTIFTMQWFYEEGATPFIRAAQSGDLRLMRLLLEAGADPLIETDWGDTALSAAAGIGWVEGVTHEWSRSQSLETLRLLLDLGLDPNSVNRDFRTPLMGAAHKGHPEIIELLVEVGARVETRDRGSRDTHKVDLSGQGGWQAVDYAEGLVRVGVQSALVHPEAAALLRSLMAEAGFEVPALDRTLGYVCAVEGELCQNP